MAGSPPSSQRCRTSLSCSSLACFLILAHHLSVLIIAAEETLLLEDELSELRYKRPKVSAEGYVYCDQYDQGFQSDKTVPLQDAEVSVKCRDLYGFVTFSAVGFTNEHGAFSIPMDDIPSIFGIAGCKARLVRSMNEQCDSLSNVGGGQTGAPLLLKSKSLKQVVFTAGPFSFHPSSTPATSSHELPNPLHHPLHNVGSSTYYPSPPPPLSHATYLYISPSPPFPSPSPPPPPPPSPPPPPPYWYRSPPPP
eukprot:c13690_g1_i1 orf=3-752(-)